MAAHPDPVDRVSTPTPPVVPPVPAGLASRIADRAPRVLVVGDALLDGWLSGPVRRLGRDGPVPVVELVHSHSTCGGAANTAANLAALGARCDLVAAVGADRGGAQLRGMLRELGAAEVLSRDETSADSDRPLERQRWAGVVDPVGGPSLAYALRTARIGAAVAALFRAQGAQVRVLPDLDGRDRVVLADFAPAAAV